MRYLKRGLVVLLVTAAILFAVTVFFGYQPVRHVLYNNTNKVVQTWQAHYGRTIGSGREADINGFFETPLMNFIVIGSSYFDPKIRFGADGEIATYFRGQERQSFKPPPEWAAKRLAWKEFRYQLDEDNKIYLVKPGMDKANKSEQPLHFPIILHDRDRSNSSLHTEPQAAR
jgi:hypothetical protein